MRMGIDIDEETIRSAPFGVALRRLREAKGLSRAELARELGFTADYLRAIEVGKRPPMTDPDKLGILVRRLGETRAVQRLLEFKAGLARDGLPTWSPTDEAERQAHHPPQEIWIVSRRILDADVLYHTTRKNIEGGTKYTFFQPTTTTMSGLLARLRGDLEGQGKEAEEVLASHVRCILATDTLFVPTSYVIGNPGRHDMYGLISFHDRNNRICNVFPMEIPTLHETYEVLNAICSGLQHASEFSDATLGTFRRFYP